MQPTKDSFYIALRDRLVAVDPNRTVTLDGATRPAIAVMENEPPNGAPLLCDVFTCVGETPGRRRFPPAA